MSEWLRTKLGTVCKFTAGSAFKPEYQGQVYGDHPFIKVSDMNLSGNEIFINRANNFISETQRKGLAAKLHPKGATAFAKIGVALTTNRRRLLTRPTILDNNMMSATPDTNKITPRYLYFLLKTLDFNTIASGSALPYLNVSDLQNLDILLPSVREQIACEDLLGSIDDKLELNQRMNETLEAMARALFKSWFVDFDPVHAKAEGRKPEGMDATTAALFPAAFNDDGLPEGWGLSTIGEEATVCGGSTPSTKEATYWDGDISWTSPKDLSSLSHPVLIDTERKITQAGLEKISSGLLPEGTVLLSSRAPIGYIAIAEIPVAINQGYVALIPNKGLPNIYIWPWLLENMEKIKSRANGSTFQEISKSNFRPIPVIVPNGEVLTLFEDAARPIYQQIVNNVFQNKYLSGLRDSLLPKLISGELRIGNVVPVRKEAVG